MNPARDLEYPLPVDEPDKPLEPDTEEDSDPSFA
jgi:hypothetical protein